MNVKDQFWQRTISLIKAHKISHKNFACYVDINYDVFRGWISKNRIPDAISACNIADALGVSVEYLVRGKDGLGEELRKKQVEEQKKASKRIKIFVEKLMLETGRLD